VKRNVTPIENGLYFRVSHYIERNDGISWAMHLAFEETPMPLAISMGVASIIADEREHYYDDRRRYPEATITDRR
jgi:hypothetical protein